MQTLIDIPESMIEQLAEVSRRTSLTQDEIIAEAVKGYIAEHAPEKRELPPGFGLWKDRGIDGLEYQLKMRAEWDDR